MKKRNEYVQQGNESYEAKKKELTDLQRELIILKSKITELETKKNELEVIEKEEESKILESPEWAEKYDKLVEILGLRNLTPDQLIKIIIELCRTHSIEQDVQENAKKISGKEYNKFIFRIIQAIRVVDFIPPPDYKNSEAESVRIELKTQEDKQKEIDNKISTIESVTNDIFWSEHPEYLYMKEKCFTGKSGKYNYNHCFFKSVDQDGTNIGHYNRTEDNVIYYTEGAQCWNGPKRSCKVILECGDDNNVIDVREPSTCVYEMIFKTPLACSEDKKAFFDPNDCENGCEL